MELFHQTVSMKSVGNLNEFVRNHMLEPFDATDRVRDDRRPLRGPHPRPRGRRAAPRDQLDALDPLLANCRHARPRSAAERGPPDASATPCGLLLRRAAHRPARSSAIGAELRGTLVAARASSRRCRARARRGPRASRDDLIGERAAAGGDRVSQLERAGRGGRAASPRPAGSAPSRFAAAAREAAGLDAVDRPAALRRAGATRWPRAPTRPTEPRQRALDDRARRGDAARPHAARARRPATSSAELASLRRRTSNLPTRTASSCAQRLCADLGDRRRAAALRRRAARGRRRARDVARRGRAGAARLRAVAARAPGALRARSPAWVNAQPPRARRLVVPPASPDPAGPACSPGAAPWRRPAARRHASRSRPAASRATWRDELARRADHRCVDTLAELPGRTPRGHPRGPGALGRAGTRRTTAHRVDDPPLVGARLGPTSARSRRWPAALDELQAAPRPARAATSPTVRGARDAVATRGRGARASLDRVRRPGPSSTPPAAAGAGPARPTAERERLLAGSSRLAEIDRALDGGRRADRAGGRRSAPRSRTSSAAWSRSSRAPSAGWRRRGARSRPRRRGAGSPRASTYAALAARLGRAGRRPRRLRPGRPRRWPRSCTRSIGPAPAAARTAIATSRPAADERRSGASWPAVTTEMDASIEAAPEFRAFHDRVAARRPAALRGRSSSTSSTPTPSASWRGFAQLAAPPGRRDPRPRRRESTTRSAPSTTAPGRFIRLVVEPHRQPRGPRRSATTCAR